MCGYLRGDCKECLVRGVVLFDYKVDDILLMSRFNSLLGVMFKLFSGLVMTSFADLFC